MSLSEIRDQQTPRYRKLVRWMWGLWIAGLVGVIATFVVLNFSDLPDTQQLENPRSELKSVVYADNGTVLGGYFRENRVPVTYDQISPNVIRALIATEDERYLDHAGIDFQALGRVVVKTVVLGKESSGGASTITQQLSKLLFTKNKGSGVVRAFQKLKEWIISVRLERRYTKEEIIAMYLNKFDFLYDSDGIKAAAETYFGKSQDELSVNEAAILVGMLKNPSLYNPRRFEKRSLKRREVVLSQMTKNKFLTKAAYDSLRVQPIDLTNFKRRDHTTAKAPYFLMELRQDVKRILERPEIRKPDGSQYDIYTDGLQIFTTIDPKMQDHAEAAMVENMKERQKRFDEVWKNKDPWTYREEDTSDQEMEARAATLNRLIEETDRYEIAWVTLFKPAVDSLQDDINQRFNMRTIDMERLLEHDGEKGYFKTKAGKRKYGEALAERYAKVSKSSVYPYLKRSWMKLRAEVDRFMSKPVEMKVFAYNSEMEKDTIMSPLDSIKYHRSFLQTGIVAVDPKTGYVKTWIGGINYKYFKYDHTQANRQVGSTIKPMVYATAIDQQGISPCFRVQDYAQTIFPGEGNFQLEDEWTPENSDGKYTGENLTLKDALRRSKNTVSVFLMKQLGDVRPVRGLMNNMGIDSSSRYNNGRLRVPNAPALCLGATDLKVMEMAGAYTTFANNGIYNRPTALLRITDKNGKILFQELPQENSALSPQSNYVMVEMLRYAAGGLRNKVKSDVGGKTGTTNDYVDSWFVGVAPELVVATWVGGEERWIRFLTLADGSGSKQARPFYEKFMKRLETDEDILYNSETRFYQPPGALGIELDCTKYFQPNAMPVSEEGGTDSNGFGEDRFGDEAFLDGDLDLAPASDESSMDDDL